MPWWAWIVAGAALLAAESAIPSDFYLVFLGLSALAVGALAALGAAGPAWAQFALFGLIAVVSLVAFRRRVRERFRAPGGDSGFENGLVGEVAVVQEPLAPGALGRAELRGSSFRARNADEVLLAPGTRARVTRVEGLLLHLRREA
jgi:membrane protein implicated in regulation of membrane protease activity